MATNLPAWFAIMPEIPLTSAVPVLHADGRRSVTLPGGPRTIDARRIRDGVVDLGHPQGFAHAFRWLDTRMRQGFAAPFRSQYAQMLNEHIAGATTDSDRLALATVCARVA